MSDVKQDKPPVQLQEICKQAELTRDRIQRLTERLAELEDMVAKAHGEVLANWHPDSGAPQPR